MVLVNNVEKLAEYYNNKTLAHAYLIETNDKQRCLSDLKCVLKKMVCKEKFSSECNKCNFCNLIDNEEFPGIFFIKSDSKIIKKEQILDLKHEMSFKPVFTDFCAYVILDSEKLNASSTNAMLKFLEEPNDNCFGFLVVDNKENVLSTIKSRCEIIVNKYENTDIFTKLNILKDDKADYIEVVKNYINALEQKELNLSINRDILLNRFAEKSEIEKIFKIILFIYQDVYEFKLGLSSQVFFTDFSYLQKQSIKSLYEKIKILIDFVNNINYNLNMELSLDKFIIEMSEIYG